MFRKIAVALVASSLIAGPVFAQSGAATATTPAPKTVTAPMGAKVDTKADVKTGNTNTKAGVKANASVKPAKIKKSKKMSARKHGKHAVHLKKHGKHFVKVSKTSKSKKLRISHRG